MLFKISSKEELGKLIDQLARDNQVIGPKKVDTNSQGKPVYHFEKINAFEEIDLAYDNTEFSAKTVLMPFKETLSRFRFLEKDWIQEITYDNQPRAIVGLHACDINAFLKLDKVFNRDFFPSPYYRARRNNTLIIGIDHYPCEGGFCRSLGTDTVTRGFDIFLTDLGDRFFIAIGSDKGFNLLSKISTKDITEEDRKEYLRIRKSISDSFQINLNFQNLPNVMDIEFKTDFWKKWGDKCLSCGTCAMVCPTCYCFTVHETKSMDFSQGEKTKQLYSCNLSDFALVAGGHNFRPDPATRLKYRYYHKFKGFPEEYGEPLCVGCNRCGKNCLSGIRLKEIIEDIQEEE